MGALGQDFTVRARINSLIPHTLGLTYMKIASKIHHKHLEHMGFVRTYPDVAALPSVFNWFSGTFHAQSQKKKCCHKNSTSHPALEAVQWQLNITCLLRLLRYISHANTIIPVPAPVRFQVACKFYLLYKIPGTEVALVTSLSGVDANVHGQVLFPSKGLGTVVTLVWEFACVCSLVPAHIRFVPWSIATDKTLANALCSGTAQMRRLARTLVYDDQACACQNDAL